MPTPHAVEHAGWEVLWVVRKKGEPRIVAIDFDRDFVGALELYLKVERAGRKMATLRCKNVGHPPPEKYLDKMRAYNRRGVWWCPYCMKLRRFEKRAWSELDGDVEYREPAYYCPICDVRHSNWWVRRCNPIAERLYSGQGRRGGGRKRRRSRN